MSGGAPDGPRPGPAGGPGEDDLDPDVLEELEAWVDPDDDGPAPGDDDPVTGADGRDSGQGAVVLVGTPIGNLGDLSPRAAEALASARVVYCEDTRHSRRLLTHAGISGVPLRSLHEHNEEERIGEILAAVGRGERVAVVSDAGLPGISDPGGRVVAAAARAGATVTVVPGPSAALTALVVSGLPTDRFCFEGFLPRSGRGRRERLDVVGTESRTIVLFEAPGRVAGTLSDLVAVCGADRTVAVARELTKLHEEVWRGTLSDAVAWAGDRPVRGEVVLVVGGAPETAADTVSDDVLLAALADRRAPGERTRGVVDAVADAFGVPRRRVYQLALEGRAAGPEEEGGPSGSG